MASVNSAGPERWSRNCGSGGLGPSGAVTAYRFGVLQGNWNEEYSGRELAETGRGVWQTGVPSRNTSTTKECYTEEGKTGEALAYISARKDRELGVEGQGRDVLTRHGDFRQPPVDTGASLNSLTYGQKQLGEPSVQSYLWSGVNRIDATVPMKTSELSLTKTKVAQWVGQADPYAGFETTQRSASLAAATAAATVPEKRSTLRPEADGGQLAQVGRKPRGPNQEECDKNYHRIDLRGA